MKAASQPGSRATAAGSTSVPIATKKSTAKRSRNGSTSRRASCEIGRTEKSTPATNAASATGTLKKTAPTPAIASAADTARMRNESGWSCTDPSSRGTAQPCTAHATTTNARALPIAKTGESPPGASSTARSVAATSVTAS